VAKDPERRKEPARKGENNKGGRTTTERIKKEKIKKKSNRHSERGKNAVLERYGQGNERDKKSIAV